MSRRVQLAVGIAAALAVLAVPAAACHKHHRSVEKRFPLSLPVPLHSYLQMHAPISCVPTPPSVGGPGRSSQHVEEFIAPAAGSLRVEVTDFVGDWDVVLLRDGELLAEGGPSRTPLRMSDGSVVEVLEYTFAKAGPSTLVICNFLGGPQGSARYVFTYAK